MFTPREENVGLDERLISWSMVAFIFLFMFSFGIAISSFPWVLMGEGVVEVEVVVEVVS